MTEPAHAHICRYIRVECERGRLAATEALRALLDAGLPETSPMALQTAIEAGWQTGDHLQALHLAFDAYGRWPRRIWFKYAAGRSALQSGDIALSSRIASELMTDAAAAQPVAAQLAELLVLLGRYHDAVAVLGLDGAPSDLTAKKQRAGLGGLIAVIAREGCWHRLLPLLDAVNTDLLLPREHAKFVVNQVTAAAGRDVEAFAKAIWPPPDKLSGAAAVIATSLCRKLGIARGLDHYSDVARQALGTALPLLVLRDWCRQKLAANAFDDVLAETERHLAADPGNTLIANYRAEALYQSGEADAAVACLMAVPAGDGQAAAELALMQARMLLRCGLPEKASAGLGVLAAAPGMQQARLDRSLLVLDTLMAMGSLADATAEMAECEAHLAGWPAPGTAAERRAMDLFIDRKARLLMLQEQVEDAMAVLPEDSANLDHLRKRIIGNIVTGDISAVTTAERSLSRELMANWKPGQGTPGYNQHLLFARNTRLNAGFKELCATIRGLGDAAALPPIRAFLQSCPLDYSAAIQLVFRMSRSGLLSQSSEDRTIAIPRRIMFFWDSPSRPPSIERFIGSWRDAHPGFDIDIFDTGTAVDWLTAHYGPRHARALRRCQHGAMKADFFRLCYLNQIGGIYADCDDRCRHPVDAWLEGRDTVLYQEHQLSFAVANNFMASIPGRPFLAEAIDQALISLEAPVRTFTFSVTGPGLLTMYVAQWLLQANDAQLRRFRLLRAAEYFERVSPHMHAPYKNTERHWLKQEGAGT